MFEAAFLRRNRVPGDALLFRFDDVAVKIGDAHRIFRQHGDFLFAQIKNIARVLQNRGNVAGDKKFAVAETDDDRRTFADGDDFVGFVRLKLSKAQKFPSTAERFRARLLQNSNLRF